MSNDENIFLKEISSKSNNEIEFSSHLKPELILWFKVIERALQDAEYEPNKKKINNYKKIIYKQDAIKWFNKQNKDFIKVCELAGKNPDYISNLFSKKMMLRKM